MTSRGVNKVILIGNLGQNPEVRYMPNGGAVANITLATSTSWRDKQTGDVKEKTEWHRVVLFGRLAEIAGEYLLKGSQIYVEGSLQTRKWQDQNGQDKYTTEIIVSIGGTMQILGNKQSTISNHSNINNSSDRLEQLQNNNEQSSQLTKHKGSMSSSEHAIDFDDDIPF